MIFYSKILTTLEYMLVLNRTLVLFSFSWVIIWATIYFLKYNWDILLICVKIITYTVFSSIIYSVPLIHLYPVSLPNWLLQWLCSMFWQMVKQICSVFHLFMLSLAILQYYSLILNLKSLYSIKNNKILWL